VGNGLPHIKSQNERKGRKKNPPPPKKNPKKPPIVYPLGIVRSTEPRGRKGKRGTVYVTEKGGEKGEIGEGKGEKRKRSLCP